MNRHLIWVLAALLAPEFFPASATADEKIPLTQRPWFETRTAHFHLYSCGQAGTAFLVATQLEQFCETYSLLAGAQAVASPPIVVMIFPDHESLKPFLPLYHGQPANLAAFFQRGSDENLIALSVPAEATAVDMSVIFHEYTHLLLRRNDGIWPLWLKEGMAELYSTFGTSGYNAVFARPIAAHVRVLAQQPLLPLAELFAVGHDSPQYNERERQGIFYAESWALTHFLVAGDNAGFRIRFKNFTPLLQAGQTPVQAFTNALRAGLPAVEAELRRYLAQGEFPPVEFALRADVTAAKVARRAAADAGGNLFPAGRRAVAHPALRRGGKVFQGRAQAGAGESPALRRTRPGRPPARTVRRGHPRVSSLHPARLGELPDALFLCVGKIPARGGCAGRTGFVDQGIGGGTSRRTAQVHPADAELRPGA